MHVVLGHSEDVETAAALDEVLAGLRSGLAAAPPPRAALVFATADYDHAQVLQGLGDALPALPVLGCTVEAISSSAHGYHEDALAAVVLCGEGLTARAAVARELSRDPRGARAACAAAGRAAVAELPGPPQVCLAFGESLTISPGEVLAGLAESVAPAPVLGGTSTDDMRFERTLQFFGRDVLSDAAACLLLGGEVRASGCADCGWYPVGIEGVVTEASGREVRRIGGETAVGFYQRYLGATLLPTGDNPLAIYEEGKDAFRLRAPLSVNQRSGAVSFMGEIPEGARVRISETCRDDILGAALRAAERARAGCAGPPAAALFFSCASRKTQLGTRTAQELEALRQVGDGCPILGLYTYGEFGSPEPGGPSRFLNQSLVALLLETP